MSESERWADFQRLAEGGLGFHHVAELFVERPQAHPRLVGIGLQAEGFVIMFLGLLEPALLLEVQPSETCGSARSGPSSSTVCQQGIAWGEWGLEWGNSGGRGPAPPLG